MNYTTPALLFSALSMFFNGYTIRYISLSKIIRDFHNKKEKDENIELQIKQFRKRLTYVKFIQFFSALSLFFSTFSVLVGFLNLKLLFFIFFISAITSFLISLFLSVREILISTSSLNISLKNGGK